MQSAEESKRDYPRFNNATLEEQVAIGNGLNYGETLIEFMTGLESDSITDNIVLGSCGDANHVPFLKHYKITHILNVAAECQPPFVLANE